MYGGEYIDKVQTSIWVDRDLKKLVDIDGLNLTKFLNDSLEEYFSAESVDKLEEEISKVQVRLNALNKKKEDLVNRGTVRSRNELVSNEAWEHLRNAYRLRRDQFLDESKDLVWLSSPSNAKRLKVLDLTVNECLKQLESWYNEKS